MRVILDPHEIDMVLAQRGRPVILKLNATATNPDGSSCVLLAAFVEAVDASQVMNKMHQDLVELWNQSKS